MRAHIPSSSVGSASKERWISLWLKWSLWLFLFGTLFFASVTAAEVLRDDGNYGYAAMEFLYVLFFYVVPYMIAALFLGGLVTLGCRAMVRDKSMLASGERMSFVKGSLIAIAAGIALSVLAVSSTILW